MTDFTMRRGDTFEESFTLSTGWTGTSFTGGVQFTVRASVPATTVTSDTDAKFVASTDDGSIVFLGNIGTITVAATVATTWNPGTYLWDLQGAISGTVPKVYTIDSGTLTVRPDITRTIPVLVVPP